MQILMQVLNTELGGDAAKPVVDAETLLPANGDGAFMALLENPGGAIDAEGFVLSEDVAGGSDEHSKPAAKDALADTGFVDSSGKVPKSTVPVAPVASDDLAQIPLLTGPNAPSNPVGVRKGESDIVASPPKVARDLLKIAKPEVVKNPVLQLSEQPAGSSDTPRIDVAAPKVPNDFERAKQEDAPTPKAEPRDQQIKPVNDLKAPEKPHFVDGKAGERTPTGDRQQSVADVGRAPIAPKPQSAPILPPVEAKASARDVQSASGPLLEQQMTLRAAQDGAPLVARKDAAALSVPERVEQAIATPQPLRPQVGTEAQSHRKSARVVRREAPPEVTLVQTTPTSAPDPAQTTQVAISTKAPVLFSPQAQGERSVLPDESPVHLPGAESSEAKRTPDTPTPRMDVRAKPVITQLVQAAKSAIDGMIEVKLSPEELGRVRLAMTSTETGMTVLVTAERAETLELIRRNIDLFAADLTEQGFEDLSFAFGREDSSEQQDGSDEHGSRDTETHTHSFLVERHASEQPPLDGRLDMRL